MAVLIGAHRHAALACLIMQLRQYTFGRILLAQPSLIWGTFLASSTSPPSLTRSRSPGNPTPSRSSNCPGRVITTLNSVFCERYRTLERCLLSPDLTICYAYLRHRQYEICLLDYVRFLAGWGFWGDVAYAKRRASALLDQYRTPCTALSRVFFSSFSCRYILVCELHVVRPLDAEGSWCRVRSFFV